MKKILGYVLSILGIIGVTAFVFPEVKNILPLGTLGNSILITLSIILVLIGVFFIIRSSGRRKKREEVPIYHGKRVVGYRRH